MEQTVSTKLGSMTFFEDATKWLSEHPFTVSLWGVLTGTLGKLLEITTTNLIVASLADITLIVSFIIGLFTVLLKAKEFVEAYFPLVKKLFKRKRK